MRTAKMKTFDCVEMKRQIQAERTKEFAGLSDDEAAQRMHENLMTSENPAAQWYRRVKKAKEQAAEYKGQ